MLLVQNIRQANPENQTASCKFQKVLYWLEQQP
jgi:hypothetical protein